MIGTEDRLSRDRRANPAQSGRGQSIAGRGLRCFHARGQTQPATPNAYSILDIISVDNDTRLRALNGIKDCAHEYNPNRQYLELRHQAASEWLHFQV